MNPNSKQARMLLCPILAVFSLIFQAAAGEPPDASQILRGARLNHINQRAELAAQLRGPKNVVPFTISLDGGVVTYGFSNPEQAILLRLGEESSELAERAGGKTAPVKTARYDERVRGSSVTYEDLALRFLYWPRPKLIGTESVSGRKAWKLEIQAPRGASQYGVARIWIDQATGAVMRIEGYNMDGRRVKKFEVKSVRKIEDQWMLKQMRVETYDPETGKITDRTYLEVLGGSGEG